MLLKTKLPSFRYLALQAKTMTAYFAPYFMAEKCSKDFVCLTFGCPYEFTDHYFTFISV